jgi:hypothetical protein
MNATYHSKPVKIQDWDEVSKQVEVIETTQLQALLTWNVGIDGSDVQVKDEAVKKVTSKFGKMGFKGTKMNK